VPSSNVREENAAREQYRPVTQPIQELAVNAYTDIDAVFRNTPWLNRIDTALGRFSVFSNPIINVLRERMRSQSAQFAAQSLPSIFQPGPIIETLIGQSSVFLGGAQLLGGSNPINPTTPPVDVSEDPFRKFQERLFR
jgi:hypothetical protein